MRSELLERSPTSDARPRAGFAGRARRFAGAADRGPVIGAPALVPLLAKELADQEVSEPAFVFVGRPGTLQHQSAIDLG